MRSGDRNAAYPILTFATNGLCTLLTLVLFFRALAWHGLSRDVRVLLTAGVAFGTLLLPYSTTFNVHGIVAAGLFIGFYFLARNIPETPGPAALFLSGLVFSLCAAMDHGTVFFYAAFGACILIRYGLRPRILWFILPAFLTLVPTAAYYYLIGGAFKPFAARPELFNYPGSSWMALENPGQNPFHERLTGEGWNSPAFALHYGFLCLFGKHGFLTYNPLLLIAICGMMRTIRYRLPFWREAIAITAASLVMMVYYFFASTNFSGWSYSIRWFVCFLYLWWFFAPAAADWFVPRRWLVAVLSVASLIYAVGGAADPWPRPDLGYEAPFANIGKLLARAHVHWFR